MSGVTLLLWVLPAVSGGIVGGCEMIRWDLRQAQRARRQS